MHQTLQKIVERSNKKIAEVDELVKIIEKVKKDIRKKLIQAQKLFRL